MATKAPRSPNEKNTDPQSIADFIAQLKLPAQDRDDVAALLHIMLTDESEEERTSASRAFIEFLAPSRSKVRPFEPDEKAAERLANWLGYVSQAIRRHRRNAGLTQAALAKKTGLDQSHISKLENGLHSPSHATLVKIAKALKIDVGKLDPSED